MHCVGIPALAAVRADTGKQDGFTRLVWQYMDGHRYRNASADVSDRLLREAYDQAKVHVMRGGRMPEEPAAAIGEEERPVVLATKEQLESHMQEVAKLFGVSR